LDANLIPIPARSVGATELELATTLMRRVIALGCYHGIIGQQKERSKVRVLRIPLALLEALNIQQ
jgi:hypothetical protein